MNKNPEIAIVLPNYNSSLFIEKTISSILNQSYKNWELIFFDNFSNDKSKDIFESFKEKRFIYFKTIKKLKLYNARRLAIKKCRGKYVSFLDTDDIWKKKKISLSNKFIRKKKL